MTRTETAALAAPRIAFVSSMTGYRWGGSEELWSRAALRLLRQGAVVSAGVQWWENPSGQIRELERAGCAIYPHHRPAPPRSLLRRVVDKVMRAPPDPVHEYRWLVEFAPDVVIHNLGSFDNGLVPMEFCLGAGLPSVILVHAANDLWPADEITDRYARVYQAARACWFVSEGNVRTVTRQLAVDLTNVTVVRNPCNVRYDACPPWPGDQNGWRLACVGRLDPSAKGQDVLLDVLARPKWRERPLTVELCGAGPCERTLRRRVAQLNLTAVRFGGHVADVEGLWAGHHGLILPSRFEGLPLVIVEAMLCGRPVIVTDVAGNAELVEDEVTGFVAQAPTADLLDAALERAWAKRAEWPEIGRRAAAAVRRAVPPDPVADFVHLVLTHAGAQK